MSFITNQMAIRTALQATTMMMHHNHRCQQQQQEEEEEERRKKKQEEKLQQFNYDATKFIAPEAYIPKHAKKEDLETMSI